LLGMTECEHPAYPRTEALFSHFRNVARTGSMGDFRSEGSPPYPADDAALHHIFDGGWMWVLRFQNGVVSAGVALERGVAQELVLSDGPSAWLRLLARFPSIQRQFESAVEIRPLAYSPNLSYRAQATSGQNWAMLPSAAAFIDPLFSTGFPLALLGIQRLATILTAMRNGEDVQGLLLEYGETTLAEADWTAAYISGCYCRFGSFPDFAALSMFYFAAASYAEMSRRLAVGGPSRFLAADLPQVAKELTACCKTPQKRRPPARRNKATGESSLQRTNISPAGEKTAIRKDDGSEPLAERVARAIAPINIAGLCDSARGNWYPVLTSDLVRSAYKLGLTPDSMLKVLESADWM
ncbi:MAG TPA: hypothetical protein VGS41_04595, partial [Chthonomonadales bacterium]|nr:hypothetical protein [Chthonomonadales bacterium]